MNYNNYDPNKALDFETRTGVKSADIDSFLAKATAVQDAIQGLKDGTLDPSKEIKIAGIETESEKKAKVDELARKKVDYLAREAKKAAERKAEEKERWWRGARLWRDFGDDDEEDDEDDDPELAAAVALSHEKKEKAATAALRQRYSLDYSRWEAPVVDDPASKAEASELEAVRDQKDAAQFETNNSEWCSEFKADQQKRVARQAEQVQNANVLRLKGNRFFKAKRFAEALEKYMGSLKEKPYEVNTLSNVSMAHLKKRAFEDSIEFSDRAIYLDPTCVKARSRRAAALHSLGRLDEAVLEAKKAVEACGSTSRYSGGSVNPHSPSLPSSSSAAPQDPASTSDAAAAAVARSAELKEVRRQLTELEAEQRDVEVERSVMHEALTTATQAVKGAAAATKAKAATRKENENKTNKPAKMATMSSEKKPKNTKHNKAAEKSSSSVATASAAKGTSKPATAGSGGGEYKKVVIEETSSDDDDDDDDAKLVSANVQQLPPPLSSSLGRPPPGPHEFESASQALNQSLPSQYKLVDDLVHKITTKANHLSGGGVSEELEESHSRAKSMDALSLLLADSKEARVYFRTGPSKGLRTMCALLCGGGVGEVDESASALQARPDGEGFDLDDLGDSGQASELLRPNPGAFDTDPARTLTLLAAACVGERRSKQALVDQGCLQAAAILLYESTTTATTMEKLEEEEKKRPHKKKTKTGSAAAAAAGGEERQQRVMMMEAVADEVARKSVSSGSDAASAAVKDVALVSSLLLLSDADDGDHDGGASKRLAVALAAAALLSQCVDDADTQEVGRKSALLVSKDLKALAGILHLLPRPSEQLLPGNSAAPSARGEAGSASVFLAVGKARCFALSASLLRDLCLLEPCRENLLKRCRCIDECDEEAAKVAASQTASKTFRFFKDTAANDKHAAKAATTTTLATANARKSEAATAGAAAASASGDEEAVVVGLAREPISALADALLASSSTSTSTSTSSSSSYFQHFNVADKATNAKQQWNAKQVAAKAGVFKGFTVEAREAAAGALANLALSAEFRGRFSLGRGRAVRALHTVVSSKAKGPHTVPALARPKADTPAAVSFALAALMNASLPPPAAPQPSPSSPASSSETAAASVEVKEALVADGFIHTLVDLIVPAEAGVGGAGKGGVTVGGRASATSSSTSSSSSSSSGVAPPTMAVRVRAAGLLGRVATAPNAAAIFLLTATTTTTTTTEKHNKNNTETAAATTTAATKACGRGTSVGIVGGEGSVGGASGQDESVLLCKLSSALVRNCSDLESRLLQVQRKGGDDEEERCQKELLSEREHLVRVFAAVLSSTSSGAAAAACAVVALLHEQGTLSLLASFLPPARCEFRSGSQEVTSASVVMPPLPEHRASFRLTGNVVKCFVSVMSDTSSHPAQALLNRLTPLLELKTSAAAAAATGLVKKNNSNGNPNNGFLERLVALLSNSKELSVRKNVAIVLAKVMKTERSKREN